MQNLEKKGKNWLFLSAGSSFFVGNSTVAVKKRKPYFAFLETTSGRARLTGIILIAVIRDDSRVVSG